MNKLIAGIIMIAGLGWFASVVFIEGRIYQIHRDLDVVNKAIAVLENHNIIKGAYDLLTGPATKLPETVSSYEGRRLDYPITDLTEEHLEKIKFKIDRPRFIGQRRDEGILYPGTDLIADFPRCTPETDCYYALEPGSNSLKVFYKTPADLTPEERAALPPVEEK